MFFMVGPVRSSERARLLGGFYHLEKQYFCPDAGLELIAAIGGSSPGQRPRLTQLLGFATD
jgi:hypothetical protein